MDEKEYTVKVKTEEMYIFKVKAASPGEAKGFAEENFESLTPIDYWRCAEWDNCEVSEVQ